MPNDTNEKAVTTTPEKARVDENGAPLEKNEGGGEEQESVYPIFTSAEEEEDQIRATREEQDGESEEESEGEPVNERSSGRPSTAQEFILSELPYRAERAEQRLREQLSAPITISLKDTGETFSFDCTANPPVCKKDQTIKKTPLVDEVKSETAASGPTCTVSIDSSNLMRIASGALNPQIAMLSNKISVTGEAGLAVYLFNLVAPRQ